MLACLSSKMGLGGKDLPGAAEKHSWCAGPKEQPGLGGNCLVKPRADWPSSAWHVACCHPLFRSWGTGPVQASSQLQALPGSSTALGMKQRKSSRDSSPSHQAACESGVGPAEHALLPSLSQWCSTESNNTWLQQDHLFNRQPTAQLGGSWEELTMLHSYAALSHRGLSVNTKIRSPHYVG